MIQTQEENGRNASWPERRLNVTGRWIVGSRAE